MLEIFKSDVCGRNIQIWCLCYKYSNLVCVVGIFALQDNTSAYGPVGASGFRTNETRFRLDHLLKLSACRTIDGLFCCCGSLVGPGEGGGYNLWGFFFCFVLFFYVLL